VSTGDRAFRCLLFGPVPTTPHPNNPSVFDCLSASTSEESKSRRKKKAKKTHLAIVSVNMTGRGKDLTRF